MIKMIILQFSIYAMLINIEISNNSKFNMWLSIKMLILNSFTKCIFLIIIALTALSYMFFSSKYIEVIAYWFVECLIAFKFRTVIYVVMIHIKTRFFVCVFKKATSTKMIFVFKSIHSDIRKAFSTRFNSVITYCQSLKS